MEVTVASVIGAFVALVAVGTLRAVSVSAERVDSNINAAAEVRFASKRIAADLVNLYRSGNSRETKLVGTVEETVDGLVNYLTFYTVGRAKARINEPEGDVYEVEYYLLKDEEKSTLCRRLWPNPEKEVEPGGILTVIADDIDVFQVRFFDGQDWQSEWPETMASVPELVEVAIATKRQSGIDAIRESFVVNFTRSAGAGADAFENSGEEEEFVEY